MFLNQNCFLTSIDHLHLEIFIGQSLNWCDTVQPTLSEDSNSIPIYLGKKKYKKGLKPQFSISMPLNLFHALFFAKYT